MDEQVGRIDGMIGPQGQSRCSSYYTRCSLTQYRTHCIPRCNLYRVLPTGGMPKFIAGPNWVINAEITVQNSFRKQAETEQRW